MADEKINIIIGATDKASGVIGKIGGAFQVGLGNLASSAIQGVVRGLGQMVDKLGDVLKSSIDTAAGFQEQIAILSAAVGDTTVSIDELHDAALQIGADTSLIGVSATEAADAMTGLYKAGLDTTDIFGDLQGYMAGTTELSGAMRAAVDLQAASSLDLAAASDAVAIAMATFGLGAEDATGIADSFVQTADASVAEVEDLVAAMETVGPTAAAFGFSLQDTNAALGILSTRGIAGAEAGTSLKSMLTNIMRPTADVTKSLRELGLSLYDDQGDMKALSQIVAEFSNALGENATVTINAGGATKELTEAADKATTAMPKLKTTITEQKAQLEILGLELSKIASSEGDHTIAIQKKQLQIQKLETDLNANLLQYRVYQGNLTDYTAATKTATAATQAMTEEQRNEYVQTLAGTYGMKAMQTLIGEGVPGWDNMTAAVSKASSAQEIAAVRSDTHRGKMEALQGTIETVKIGLGEAVLEGFTPLISTFADLISEHGPQLEKVFTILGEKLGVWVADLLPKLIKFVEEDLIPGFEKWTGTLETDLIPALEDTAKSIGDVLSFMKDFKDLSDKIAPTLRTLTDAIKAMGDPIWAAGRALDALKLPSWLTPGSPTPLELAFVGIRQQVTGLTADLPGLIRHLDSMDTLLTKAWSMTSVLPALDVLDEKVASVATAFALRGGPPTPTGSFAATVAQYGGEANRARAAVGGALSPGGARQEALARNAAGLEAQRYYQSQVAAGINIYGGLQLNGVQNPMDLVTQLQALMP